ncbi:hypothetical protein EDB89DRAFT_2077821 [Lactarius sanguifluus]|nr:hypothetical protein EDB89DRAFT_2077821 [Lactarius sanguifluus]
MAGTQTPAVLLLITSDPRGRITQLPIKLAMIDGVEFCSLPSGLHLYLTKDGLRDMYIFTQRQTSEKGQRGFHLSSLGILLARSFCPRPWHHVPALKALGNSSQDVWEPVRRFFGLRKARLEDLGGAGAWHRWSEELEFDMDDGGVEDGSDGYEVLLTGTLVGKQSQVDDSIIAYAFDKALPGDSNGASSTHYTTASSTLMAWSDTAAPICFLIFLQEMRTVSSSPYAPNPITKL